MAILINYTITDTKIGRVLIAESLKGISAIFLGGDDLYADLRKLYPDADLIKKDIAQCNWARDVVSFIAEPRDAPFIPLDVQGTDFQRRVWSELISIPLGETISYKELAEKVGKPNGARAVANACGANKIPLLIPCHRVISSDGSLGGFSAAGGVETKRKLLEAECKYNPDLKLV